MKNRINRLISFTTEQDAWPLKLAISFFLATTIGIIVYTMVAAFHYSSNAILGRDEANFVILNSEKILASKNIIELFQHLIANKGPHMTLGMNLVNMFTYFVFGALDRRIMNVIGVMMLCAAIFVLAKRSTNKKLEFIFVCATIFPLILSPTHNACIINASCTCNHYLGIALSVISLYFFTRISEKIYFFIFAEIFMLIGVCSLAASVAMIPISFVFLYFNSSPKRKLFILLNILCIALIIGFHIYASYPHTIFELDGNTSSFSIYDMFTKAVLFLATFFIIMGSLFYWLNDAGYGAILAMIGFIVFIVTIITVIKFRKYFQHESKSFYYYGILLLLTMILMISYGRYFSFGSSRYSVYSEFLYAMLLLIWFGSLSPGTDDSSSRKRIKILILSSTISLMYYFVALHYHRPYLIEIGEKDDFCRHSWYTDGIACGVMIHHEEATHIINAAIDQGIYRVEK